MINFWTYKAFEITPTLSKKKEIVLKFIEVQYIMYVVRKQAQILVTRPNVLTGIHVCHLNIIRSL